MRAYPCLLWLILLQPASLYAQSEPPAASPTGTGPTQAEASEHRTEVWDGAQKRWVKAVKLQDGSTIPVGEYNGLWDPNDAASKEEIGRGYNRYTAEGTTPTGAGPVIVDAPRKRGGSKGTASARVTHPSCSTKRVRRG